MRSMSSRNFRNMIQVSIGSLSRSPFSPLSLRMIWRADLMMRSSRWATVSGLAPAFFWIVSLGTCYLARTIGLMKRITGSAHGLEAVLVRPVQEDGHPRTQVPPRRRCPMSGPLGKARDPDLPRARRPAALHAENVLRQEEEP